MKNKWIPVWGEFATTDDDGLTFLGKVIELLDSDPPRRQAAVGKALSNQLFNGGTISVDVTFSAVPEKLEQQSFPKIAEMAIFNDVRSGDMVTAGIGGDFYFYSARVWDDRSSKWRESVIKGGLAKRV